ncbi:hypothetical protein [Halorubellus sp. JP-L1]|uniref:mechanosensitive ion channel family protein n=1 Tax=Halorubellus sp. JP-L1 TaxID=2715753 RepID=UPI0034E9513E
MSDAIDQAIADAIEYLPSVVAALLILIVGYVVGRVLGGIVTRIVERIGLSSYAEGTAMEDSSDGDTAANALGKIVSYYVYFVALVAAADVLQIAQLTEILTDLAEFLPVVLGALVVLVVGFVVARIVGDVVADLVGGFDIGSYLTGTPLERMGDTEGEFGRIVGLLVTYYIYLLTLLAVADILEVDALSELLETFVSYLPALAGGLLVLLVGIWVAELVGDAVLDMGDGRSIRLASLAVKVFIYYITVTIALAAIGFEIAILTSLFTAFVVAFFGALALALAIGIGLAVGLGGQDYVAENVDDWMSSAQDSVEGDSVGGDDVLEED